MNCYDSLNVDMISYEKIWTKQGIGGEGSERAYI
jgi:hypothetical protein